MIRLALDLAWIGVRYCALALYVFACGRYREALGWFGAGVVHLDAAVWLVRQVFARRGMRVTVTDVSTKR